MVLDMLIWGGISLIVTALLAAGRQVVQEWKSLPTGPRQVR